MTMTEAEFRSRFERLGVLIEGSGVPTHLVRDGSGVIRMAHVLGPQDGQGSVHMAAVARLTAAAQQEIVERCLVDGVWVVVSRNLDDFVDFERWLLANAEPPSTLSASNVFGPRLEVEPEEGSRARPTPEPARALRRPAAGPRPTEVFGPEVVSPFGARPSGHEAKPTPIQPPLEGPPRHATPLPVDSPSFSANPSAQRERGPKPRVFWRDITEHSDHVDRAVVTPSGDPPAPPSVPAPRLVSSTIEEEEGALGRQEPPVSEFAAPDPLPSYRAHPEPADRNPISRLAATLNQSMPRIPLPPGLGSAARFTSVVSGRSQGTLDDSQPADDSQDQEGGGLPKWVIVTLAVVAVLAVVVIVIGFVI